MLYSIYHMALKLLLNRVLREKTLRFSILYERHCIELPKSVNY